MKRFSLSLFKVRCLLYICCPLLPVCFFFSLSYFFLFSVIKSNKIFTEPFVFDFMNFHYLLLYLDSLFK